MGSEAGQASSEIFWKISLGGICHAELGDAAALMGLFIALAFLREGQPRRDATAGKPIMASSTERDLANVNALGSQAVAYGAATQFDVSSWHKRLDLSVGATSDEEGRAVAARLCQAARENFTWSSAWTIRVFLATGERPIAICATK